MIVTRRIFLRNIKIVEVNKIKTYRLKKIVKLNISEFSLKYFICRNYEEGVYPKNSILAYDENINSKEIHNARITVLAKYFIIVYF